MYKFLVMLEGFYFYTIPNFNILLPKGWLETMVSQYPPCSLTSLPIRGSTLNYIDLDLNPKQTLPINLFANLLHSSSLN